MADHTRLKRFAGIFVLVLGAIFAVIFLALAGEPYAITVAFLLLLMNLFNPLRDAEVLSVMF